jgi:AraC-like DNA-binding protein
MAISKIRASTYQRRISAVCGITENALRVQPILGLLQLLVDRGIDTDKVIRSVGCNPADFRDPENTIGFKAVGKLLMQAATVKGLHYPGLEFGRRLGLDVLGPLGNAIRLAPDVGTALRALILYFHLHDRGAMPSLWEAGDRTMFGYTLYCPDVQGVDHIYDAALAISYNVLSDLVGKEWQSIEVHMFREPPEDMIPFDRHFRTQLRFRMEHAAIVFPTPYLQKPLPAADSAAYARALHDLDSLDSRCDNRLYKNKIRRVMYRKFIGGRDLDRINLSSIAQLLELHPRTLNRRLSAEGTTFNALLAETRYTIAQQLLRDTELNISDIALILGYAESASFNHAFRRWSGSTAKVWRSLNKSTQP